MSALRRWYRVLLRGLTYTGIAVGLSGCPTIGGGGTQETYQQILGMLCAAPPNIMQNVLTTPQLQQAWTFICSHVQSVPPTPVSTMRVAGAT